MSYSHITPNQKNELAALLRAKVKKKDIANILNKHISSIYRELQRNRTNNKSGYDARLAKDNTRQRRINANRRFRKIDNNPWIQRYVLSRIKNYWSPEQICGRLKTEYPNQKDKHISKDSIYIFIYSKHPECVKYLRCQKGKYRRRYGTRIREKQREEQKKIRIDKRPEIANKRQRIGDWEGDTVVSKRSKGSVLLTTNERLTGYVMIDKLKEKKAELLKDQTIKRFKAIPKRKKYTITYDNGSEFSEHESIEKKTKMKIYFAYPYHSWERGSNENTNGLIRQFFPKKTCFDNILDKDIKKVERLLNNRPRKRLNYLTPKEVFNSF